MLRVGLEGDLGRAACAADVEAEDADGVVFLLGRFFARVEFAAFVDELAAGCAAHAEGRHQTDGLYFWTCLLGTAAALEFRRVEVGRVVLREDLTFRHFGGVVSCVCGVIWTMRNALVCEMSRRKMSEKKAALSDAKLCRSPRSGLGFDM